MEQGARTGAIFRAIQSAYREILAQEQDKAAKNAQAHVPHVPRR